MKHLGLPLLSLLVTAGATSALASPELAQKKVCLSCHGVEKRTGFPAPSFNEVAQKYAGQKEAVNNLLPKIMKGGTGVWGVMTMPANPQLSDAEGRQLLAWILSLK